MRSLLMYSADNPGCLSTPGSCDYPSRSVGYPGLCRSVSFPPIRMIYTTYFRVTTEAENQLEATRKAARLIKEEPLAFSSGTYEGSGKKKKSWINTLFFW